MDFAKFPHLKGDIFGGITAGIVALPLALAFGVQSGMGAEAGLYGAIGLGIFAALFGGTNTQISGPTGPITVVSASMIALIISHKGSFEAALPTVLFCFFLAGGFMVLVGTLRIGQYIKDIPYPVVSGFMTGIGVIIIILQFFPMLGYESPKTIPDILSNLNEPLGNIHWPSLALTILTMTIVYVFPKISKSVPSTLIALVVVTLITEFISIEVKIIGNIPSGLPEFHFDLFTVISDFKIVLMPAITLAALGAIDSLLTSVVADNVTRTSHNSNKELIGQGIGNMVSGFIGGIPGAGATMRTLVNINSGGTTKLSGTIHGVFLLLVLLGISALASRIPLPVLSGILLTVGINIVDRRGLSHIGKITKSDAFVLIIVLILTVFVDLLQAVAAGMIISSVIFIKQMGDITQKDSSSTSIQTSKEAEKLHDRYHIPREIRPFVSIKKINGPLFFGNSEYFLQLSKKVGDDIKVLIIDLKRVPYIDQSGLYALESIVLYLEKKGIQVFLLYLQKQPEAMMRNILLIPNVIELETIFDDEKTCAESVIKLINK